MKKLSDTYGEMESLGVILLCVLLLSLMIGGAIYINYVFDKYTSSTEGTTWLQRRHRRS